MKTVIRVLVFYFCQYRFLLTIKILNVWVQNYCRLHFHTLELKLYVSDKKMCSIQGHVYLPCAEGERDGNGCPPCYRVQGEIIVHWSFRSNLGKQLQDLVVCCLSQNDECSSIFDRKDETQLTLAPILDSFVVQKEPASGELEGIVYEFDLCSLIGLWEKARRRIFRPRSIFFCQTTRFCISCAATC